MDFGRARHGMVEGDLRGRGITDPRVLAAFETVPREDFVPASERGDAYGDFPIPIGHSQTISQPYIVARMTEALELAGTEKVLDIGTGSGYQAAILSCLAREVHTIERIPELLETARARLTRYPNCLCHTGDGTEGLEPESPFDAIVVAAQANEIPPALLRQTAPGGRLVIPVGGRPSQDLLLYKRAPSGWRKTFLDPVRFVPLISGP